MISIHPITLEARQRTHQRQGVIIVLTVLCLVFVTAFLAFSLDWGYMVVTESELQDAADAGAISAAKKIPEGREAVIAAAQLWAGKNVGAGEPIQITRSDVELGTWDSDTAVFTVIPEGTNGSPSSVRVTCRRTKASGNPLKLFIGPLIGTSTADLSASAVSTLEQDQCGMIVGRDYVVVDNGDVDSYDSSLGSYASQSPRRHGNVCSDGAITLRNNGHVLGDALPGRGYTVNLPANVTGSTRPRLGPIRWTPIDLQTPASVNDNAAIPAWAWTGSRLMIADTSLLTLPPGTYYLPDGFDVTGSAAIEVTGPTRFVVGGRSLVAGRGIVNSTSVPANLRIDAFGTSIAFSGSSEFHADIYGPETAVTLNGSADFFGAVFAQSITFNGNMTTIHADEALERNYASFRVRGILKD